MKILVGSERPVVARSESCALCTCVRPSSGCVGSKIHDHGHSHLLLLVDATLEGGRALFPQVLQLLNVVNRRRSGGIRSRRCG